MTVKQKQALLAYLGYYDGQLDGIWGEKSQWATIDFQRAVVIAKIGKQGLLLFRRHPITTPYFARI